MSIGSVLYSAYLRHFSRPPSDRAVYRAVCELKATRLIEVGVGTAERAQRMIRLARLCSPDSPIRYVGLDPFEARRSADGPGLSLKRAHCLLSHAGARVRLLPGDPPATLAAVSNGLGQADLLLFSARLDAATLAASWYYVPRLLHANSRVYVESLLPGGKALLRLLPRDQLEALAAVRRRAA